jgi:asparaginyl-tRNA synthetase
VEKYPAHVKAFYMKRDLQDESRVLCADLLAPGLGEIIGGSQREENLDIIIQRIKEQKLPIKDFEWYLDLRRYGTVPHSGFGLGLERCVQWICGLTHIREAIPFPRLINRLKP